MAVNRPRFPVPVFAAVGAGARGPVQELRARSELRLVSTPRHASVLLTAGRVAAAHADALDRVHDQLPHPRATVSWSGADAHPGASTGTRGDADAVVAAVLDAHVRVTTDPSASEPDRLPDEEPNDWRGVGPHGQGGEGMMGGTPYGRPMAMTGPDRDGMALDQLHLRLGPFLEWLPPGVVLDVTMQGDVLQAASAVLATPRADDLGGPVETDEVDPARAGLRWLAGALHSHGLDALAARAAGLATAPTGEGDVARAYDRLRRSVRRSGLLWSISGVGGVEGLGDAADRWRHRLAAIADALAGAPGERDTDVHLTWDALGSALEGASLGDAVTTIVSLEHHLVVPQEVTAS